MKETRFKNTELGPIPEDWEVKRIEDISHTASGGTPSRAMPNFYNGQIKWFTTSELQDCYLHDSNEHISSEALAKSSAKLFETGTLLMAMYGATIGKLGILKTEAATNQACCAIKPHSVNSKYLYFWLYSIRNILISQGCGAGQPNISQAIVKSTQVVFPPLSEQVRIAEALSDVDALIAELGELIEKKRLVKQGTMQQLLTASRRLPGFSKPWVEKELGKIGTTYSGLSGKTKEDFGVGDSKYITFLNVLTNPRIRTDLFEPVSVGIEEKQNKAEKGDLFFNTSSETPEEVGICSYLDEDIDDLYLNSFCFGYRINDSKVYPLYLAYFFRSGIGRELMSMMAQGVTRYNISKSAFNKASIFIPSDIAEQRAIAEILTDMDNEIAELEAKREKYRAIKDGMMQQLLTGRIRLIDPTASTDSATSVASSNPAGVSPHAPVITYEPTTAYPQSLAAEP